MLLVIGATGHTGKYFLQELKDNNYTGKVRFLVRDNLSEDIFKDYNLNYEVVQGDLNNKEDIQKACKDIDTILEIYNIKYSLNVLESALKENVKRIIFVHTTGIYSKYKMASGEYKIIEKEVIEKAKGKIDITILRPTMIYGDICDHNISKFIKMMDKMRIYPLIAGGKAKIQPVNARDLGKAYYQVLVNEGKTRNKDYNLSGEAPISIKEMLKTISKKLNKKTLFIPIPLWFSVFCAYILKGITLGKIDIVEKVLRMDEDRCFDNNNARQDFGYTTIEFQKGLEEEVRQYKNNKSEQNDEIEKKAIILTTVPSTIEQFNMENIKLLKQLGYKVEVASNFNVTGNIDNNRFNKFMRELEQLDVKVNNISFSRKLIDFNNFRAYFQLKRLFKEQNYQLLHCHTPICGAITRLVARKKRKNGLKVIYTAHGFHFYKGAPILNWLIYYPVEKICSKWTDCLIAINKEDYELAKKKLKTRMIYKVNGTGVDTRKFEIQLTEKDKSDLKKELKITDNDFVIVCIGELNKNKNQIMQINAMKKIVNKYNNIKLLLIGKGALRDYYEQKVEELNLQNNVFLLGYRKDVSSILNIANCLVSTSMREGLGLNIIEGMSAGIPVIATNNRGHRELIDNSNNGYLIKINDEEDFIKAIYRIMNKINLDKIVKNAKNTAKKYDVEIVKEQLKKIYSSIQIKI